MLNCVFSRRTDVALYWCWPQQRSIHHASSAKHSNQLAAETCRVRILEESFVLRGHRYSRAQPRPLVAQVARSAARSPGVHQGVSALATEPSHRLRHIRFAEYVSLMQPHVINMRRNQLRSQQTVYVLVGKRVCAIESHAPVVLLFLR